MCKAAFVQMLLILQLMVVAKASSATDCKVGEDTNALLQGKASITMQTKDSGNNMKMGSTQTQGSGYYVLMSTSASTCPSGADIWTESECQAAFDQLKAGPDPCDGIPMPQKTQTTTVGGVAITNTDRCSSDWVARKEMPVKAQSNFDFGTPKRPPCHWGANYGQWSPYFNAAITEAGGYDGLYTSFPVCKQMYYIMPNSATQCPTGADIWTESECQAAFDQLKAGPDPCDGIPMPQKTHTTTVGGVAITNTDRCSSDWVARKEMPVKAQSNFDFGTPKRPPCHWGANYGQWSPYFNAAITEAGGYDGLYTSFPVCKIV